MQKKLGFLIILYHKEHYYLILLQVHNLCYSVIVICPLNGVSPKKEQKYMGVRYL